MSCSSSPFLTTSPVAASFPGLCWNPLVADKCSLNETEKSILRSVEEQNGVKKNTDYSRVLIKMLQQATSSPSCRVSKLEETLSESEALRMLYSDSVGVVTHYAIYKLIQMILDNKENTWDKTKPNTTTTTFYDEHGFLCMDIQPLIRILHADGDDYAQRGASLGLAHILTAIDSEHTTELLKQVLSWVAYQLMSSMDLTIVMPSLLQFMSSKQARSVFADCGGIGCMAQRLLQKSGATSVQQLYELTFCMWYMSLDCENDCPNICLRFARDGAIPALVDMVHSAPREKVVRVALACLAILASTKSTLFLGEMLDCGLLSTLDKCMDNTWSTDIDMVTDLKLLHKLLHENYKELSSDWELFVRQVESGLLEWGAMHTCTFFRQHARRFEDNNFGLVKRLIELVLEKEDDDDVVAIACFDIGEFVRHYPNGRSIIRSLGGKNVVMSKMEHENPEVQRHALQAMSKILIKNWEGLA